MRARDPDAEGYVERDGVRVLWQRYGEAEPTVLLLPTWSILHSRHWKLQIPYLARHFRVLTFDGRGNGRSDRPEGAGSYTEREFAADTLAVMDTTATERAVLISLSCGTPWSTLIAADHPERVAGLVCIGPAVSLARRIPSGRFTRSRSRWRPRRAGPSTTGTTGCATTAGSWSTSSPAA